MADYVLIHGGALSVETWNRIAKRRVSLPGGYLGGHVWDPVVPLLQAHHHRVFAPTLGDEHQSNLTGHIGQVRSLLAEKDLRDVLLVGHSYGGMVITGAATEMPDRIRQLVYVDAALPEPGQSLFDIIRASGNDPLTFHGLEPAAAFVEKLHFDEQAIASIPKTYIRCTESDFASVTDRARRRIAAAKGWTYLELQTSHVPMASLPEQFARLLLRIGKP